MVRVQVFMSTYNGGQNIIKQVDSILTQKKLDVLLTIRDDGSNKKTRQILLSLKEKHENIDLFFEENIGYKKSFLSLFDHINKDMDYYALADQDDFWKEEKLYLAIKKLENIPDTVKLYTSSLDIVDEELNIMGKHDISKIPNNIYSLFTRMRYAGCTYVFSKKLAEIIVRNKRLDYLNSEMPDHDFLIAAFAYTYGKVIVDPKSYINHIRYSTSVTSGGNGIVKRLQVEYRLTFKTNNTRYNMARILLSAHGNGDRILDPNILNYLNQIVNYKKYLRKRLSLMKYINCGNKLCNLETSIKILLGKF